MGTKAQRGRPTKYTREIADRICARLATGESLRAICRDDEALPTEAAVRHWAAEDRDGFFLRYTYARNIGLDAQADLVIEIADDPTLDPHDRRIRFDARRWYLSKLAPKRYGDRQHVEHGVEQSLADVMREIGSGKTALDLAKRDAD